MTRCLITLFWLVVPALAAAAPGKLNVLVVFAHPDEGEIYAGGTAALYGQLGHRVKFLSLTNGDAGHWSMAPATLAARRLKEAEKAKKILGLADYEVFDYHDGKLENTREIQAKVAARIAEWDADVVFLFYPITAVTGGHNDNMKAGLIVRDAASLLTMKRAPAFLYMRDYFTTGFSHIPDLAVAIDAVWQAKLRGCGAHESQVVEANPHADGVLDEVLASEEKRREYLFYNAYPYSRVTPDIRLTLTKWYGREQAREIEWAEAFELAEFGRPIDDAAIGELFPMLGRTFTVPGNQAWLDTGIDLATGQTIEIRAEGEVVWKKGGFGTCGPDGAVPYTQWGKKAVLGASTGALVARIGSDLDKAFFVGSKQAVEACCDGRLFLGINDDNLLDNTGFFTVWTRPFPRK